MQDARLQNDVNRSNNTCPWIRLDPTKMPCHNFASSLTMTDEDFRLKLSGIGVDSMSSTRLSIPGGALPGTSFYSGNRIPCFGNSQAPAILACVS